MKQHRKDLDDEGNIVEVEFFVNRDYVEWKEGGAFYRAPAYVYNHRHLEEEEE